jgi:hydrogenase/urease accessory protein HupE
MIGVEFDFGFGLVLRAERLFFVLLAAGLWAGLLSGRSTWTLPGSALVGLAAGMVATRFGYPPPYAAWVVPASLILLGAAVAMEAQPPRWLAAIAVAAAAVYQGNLIGALEGRALLTWIGTACGVVFALAGGIGLVAMATQARARVAVRAGGAVLALLGALWLLGVA